MRPCIYPLYPLHPIPASMRFIQASIHPSIHPSTPYTPSIPPASIQLQPSQRTHLAPRGAVEADVAHHHVLLGDKALGHHLRRRVHRDLAPCVGVRG